MTLMHIIGAEPYSGNAPIIESYIDGISLSSFLIISAISSPSLFPLLAHRLAYLYSEFLALLVLRYLPLERRRLHLGSNLVMNSIGELQQRRSQNLSVFPVVLLTPPGYILSTNG